MIKNILYYLALLFSVFVFSIFYFEWFSWVLLVITVLIPILSLLFSLPFMILCRIRGIFLFTNDKINIRESLNIGACAEKKSLPFVPAMRIRLAMKNSFSRKSFKMNLGIAGSLKEPKIFSDNRFSEHCGAVEINVKSCRVYDLMGIFFIPVRTVKRLECDVMPIPEKPKMLPDFSDIAVVGFKPKSGGGFSDYYELRPFCDGDSLKSVHWKVSSKYDELIVREPSVPVFKRFALRLALTDDPEKNDGIMARFHYTARHILKNGISCCCCRADKAGIYEISSESELTEYITAVYKDSYYRNESPADPDMLMFTISEGGEEVGLQ